MEEVRHNCGVCLTHSLHDAYNFLKSSQHRGREATGIAAISKDKIDVVKWIGPVTRFDLNTLYEILDGGSPIFMGHVRYATTGRKETYQILQDAHPIAIDGKVIRKNNHIIIRNCRIAGVHNGQVGRECFGDFDFGHLNTGTDTEMMLRFYDAVKEEEVMKKIPGAYTIAIAEKGKTDVVLMRDRTGVKPGIIGWKDGKFVMASEDFVFKENGAETREEISPGSIYYMSHDGRNCRRASVVDASPRYCFFEWNYIANVESTLSDVSVQLLRRKLGEKLSEEFSREIDSKEISYVTYLPSCPKEAAISLAKKLGIPFLPIFYKQDKERAFQGSNSDDRKCSIERNLGLIDLAEEKISGKEIIVVDDSTIRGNNCKWMAQLLNKVAKVKRAYLLNYTPQMGIIPDDGIPRGCIFGVDIPPVENDEHKFIARGRSIEEISQKVGMGVRYLSVNGMLEVFEQLGIPRNNLCTFCIGGRHPFAGLERKVGLTVGAT